jgi:uncharacterized protein with HEPN domain
MNLEKDKVYVEHILDCIDKINQYTGSDKQRFIGNDLVQDGVLRRLQTMAESTQRLSDDLKQTAPDVDNYLPALKRAVEGIASQLVEND